MFRGPFLAKTCAAMEGYLPQVMFAVVPPAILVPPIAAPVGIDIATEAGLVSLTAGKSGG